MIQNRNSMYCSTLDPIRGEMSNCVPSWFAQSAAACVLSGESLFGSAQEATHQSIHQNQ